MGSSTSQCTAPPISLLYSDHFAIGNFIAHPDFIQNHTCLAIQYIGFDFKLVFTHIYFLDHL